MIVIAGMIYLIDIRTHHIIVLIMILSMQKNNSQEVIKYDDEEDTQSAEVHLAELAKSIHPKRTIASSCREMLKELKDLTFEPYDPMLKMAECMECNEWIHATCGKIPAKVFSNKHEIYICRSFKK